MLLSYVNDLRSLLGLENVQYRYGLSSKELFDQALKLDRGRIHPHGSDNEPKAYATSLGSDGPLIFYSDPSCTGRPVQDTFGVAWPEVESKAWWKGDFQKFDPDHFWPLVKRVSEHLNRRQSTLFVQDVYCGWDVKHALPYRFVGEYATHAMFAQIMFPKHLPTQMLHRESERWTMLNVPSFRCDPSTDGTRSDRAVILDFRNRIVLALGRSDYCGVIKKGMFTVMNYHLPEYGELSMHCAANLGEFEDSAILFGLSGTGKTTLSADPDRLLIGDDEHGWTDEGVTNFEDGCYAKLIDLDKDAEPIIATALSQPGTLIENVPRLSHKPLSETDPRELDLSDRSITENTRISYPLSINPNVASGASGPHPETIVLLTADAFGVLPPISILDEHDVMYHFVSGYTSKLAGTEVGVIEPQATFSACFGAPFMSRPASVYAGILADKIRQHKARCIMLNTGWTGGGYGHGSRFPIKLTRAMLDAALAGKVHDNAVEYHRHPVFGLRIPAACPGVPAEMLDPKSTWSDSQAYDRAAVHLKELYQRNFRDKGFADLGLKSII